MFPRRLPHSPPQTASGNGGKLSKSWHKVTNSRVNKSRNLGRGCNPSAGRKEALWGAPQVSRHTIAHNSLYSYQNFQATEDSVISMGSSVAAPGLSTAR